MTNRLDGILFKNLIRNAINNLEQYKVTINELNALFQQLEDNNVLRVAFSGGEPFARKDFFDILAVADKYSFLKVINSNGTLINDSVAHRLKNHSIETVCVSIDGSSSKQHDSIRGKGTFIKTLKGVRALQKNNIKINSLFTLTKDNIDFLLDTIKLNEYLGINNMTVMVVCLAGRAADDNKMFSKEKWYPLFLKLSEMKLNNEFNIQFTIMPPNESDIYWLFYFPLLHYNRLDLLSLWTGNKTDDYLEKNRAISCQAGTKNCSISSNGDVYGCELMSTYKELCAGNIRKDKFIDIWNNSKIFNKLRKLNVTDLNGKCKECSYYWCGGGCRSTAYSKNNEINSSDESCFME